MYLDGNYLFCESIIVFFTNKAIVNNILSTMTWLFKYFKLKLFFNFQGFKIW